MTLPGKKTYLVAIATAALVVAHTLGFIDETTYQSLLALLAAMGGATIAAKINRVEDKLK